MKPYRLGDDQQKAELAKDLSAFANTLGGFIVLGVKTTRIPDYNADVAQELRPVSRNLFPQEQYEAVARDWIYPSLNELRLHFLPVDWVADKGVLVLEIPPSTIRNRPFLIVKGAGDNKRKDRRITFGYAERFRGRSLAVVVQRLQQLLHLGTKFETYESFQQGLETRLESLGTRMERLEGAMLQQAQTDESAMVAQRETHFEESVQRVAKEVALDDRPRLIMGAVPEQSVQFLTLFSSRQDPLVRVFENPPELRDSGFDFALGRPSEIVQGAVRRIAIPGYKAIQLSVDGELIVLLPGDDDFLAWASMRKLADPIRINSFVLAEVVYTFTLYVKNLYAFGQPPLKSIRLYIGMAMMTVDDAPAILTSAKATPHRLTSELTDKKAPLGTVLLHIRAPLGETAERMAFLLRAKLYNWFGFDESQVPYVTEESDGTRVVTQQSLFKKIPE